MVKKGPVRSSLFFYIFAPALLLFPKYALAGCDWSTGAFLGIQGGINVTDVTLELATFKMMSYRYWSNDSRFPVGSLMALETFALKGRFCASLAELKGSQLDVVYAPPAAATPYGSGFMIPSTADGVALAVEFPSGSPHMGGVYLGSSTGKVLSGGQLNGGLPSIPIRLSLIKTGTFTALPRTIAALIDFPGGIGWLKYYSKDNPSIVSTVENRLRMDPTLSAGDKKGFTATVHAPVCDVLKIGTVSLENAPNIQKSNIKLSSVSAKDFETRGALDKAAKVLQFRFECNGTINTKASVSFDAMYPHNSGVDGVGMSKEGADVGIQILLNDVPVRFGQYSTSLVWNAKTYRDHGLKISDSQYGVFDPQGLYCVKDCGHDMTNANWIDGGAAFGNNDGNAALLTFKYYQTTNKTPAPQSFLVPFTITLNVN